MAIASVYSNEIHTQLLWRLTHPLALAELVSGSTSPNFSLQQPSLSDRRLSLTVANSYLLTALGPCLSSSSSDLVGDLARKSSVWVSRQNRQRNPLSGAHPHSHTQNECSPSCHTIQLVGTLPVYRRLQKNYWRKDEKRRRYLSSFQSISAFNTAISVPKECLLGLLENSCI